MPKVGRLARIVLPAAVVVAGVVSAVLLASGGSSADRARATIQSLFASPATSKQSARVRNCGQVGANLAARIYLCDVVTPSCIRIIRFAVYRQSAFGAAPVTAAPYVLSHLCTPAHY